MAMRQSNKHALKTFLLLLLAVCGIFVGWVAATGEGWFVTDAAFLMTFSIIVFLLFATVAVVRAVRHGDENRPPS